VLPDLPPQASRRIRRLKLMLRRRRQLLAIETNGRAKAQTIQALEAEIKALEWVLLALGESE
jgi:DNA recombination-dependent growth factor C